MLSVLLGQSGGGFSSPISYPIPADATRLIVADFNNDGNPDLGVAAGASVFVMLGRPDGSFVPGQSFTVPGNVFSLLAVDVNGDGKADLITANETDNVDTAEGFCILLGNGDGTFQPAVQHALTGNPTARELAAGDFNSDGKVDLVVVESYSNCVQTFLGDGKGNFAAGDSTCFEPGNFPVIFSVAAGDLNGDGRLDLFAVYTNDGTQCYVRPLVGNGDGSFRLGLGYPVVNSQFVQLADLDGDGRLDAVTSGSAVTVLRGNGDGTFQPPVFYAPGNYSTAIADFNGDGHADVAATDSSGEISLLINDGSGAFAAARDYNLPVLYCMTAADINDDHLNDVLSTDFSGNLYVLYGQPDGTLGSPVPLGITNSGGCISVADFNKDGIPDLVIQSDSGLSILYGKGDGTFTPGSQLQIPFSPGIVRIGDLNNDGILDLVVYTLPGGIQVYIGNKDGSFTLNRTHISTPDTNLILTDVDGDGNLDLVDGSVFFLGDGHGGFGPAQNLGFYALAAPDLNGDQKPDFISVENNALVTYLNSGNDRFSLTAAYAPGLTYFYGPLAMGDFNHDGRIDLAFGLSVLLGSGDGTLQNAINYVTGVQPSYAGYVNVAADLNGDGVTDLAVANGNGTITVFLSRSGVKAYVTSSPNPAGLGQPVTLSATLSALDTTLGIPTGRVIFLDGDTPLGLANLVNGKAQFSTSGLAQGTHTIRVSYSGDSTFPRSRVSSTVDEVILASLSTTTMLAGSPATAQVGQPITLTAAVTSPFGNPVSGAIQFLDFSVPLATISLQGSSTAVLNTSSLTSGVHLISAVYKPAAGYAPSSSSPLVELVQPAGGTPVNVATVPAVNPMRFRQQGILNCTVTSSSGTPSGTVVLYDGVTVLAQGALDANGQRFFSIGPLAPGAHNLLVVYSGASSFSPGFAKVVEYSSPKPH